MRKIIKGIFFLVVLMIATLSYAADVDRKFLVTVLSGTECEFDENFPDEFASAIDRLEKINPEIVYHVRSSSYKGTLNMVCDLEETSSIYFAPQDQTIHLRKNASSDWKTPASFFHEFLHFVGVEIDHEYHSNPSIENILEVDNVYACHMAVFPRIMEFAQIESSRWENAVNRCAQAKLNYLE